MGDKSNRCKMWLYFEVNGNFRLYFGCLFSSPKKSEPNYSKGDDSKITIALISVPDKKVLYKILDAIDNISKENNRD
jgi:hypothetical protein